MNEREHLDYFDYLRIIGAISVIFMHVAAGPLRGEVNLNWQLLNLFTSLAFIAVPLFFMMSGYLLLSNKKTANISILLKKRLPHLIIPLIGWTIVASIWYTFSNNQPFESFFVYLLKSISAPIMVHFWFMYTLIAIYIISPLLYGGIQSLDREGKIFTVSLIGLVSLNVMVIAILPSSVKQYAAVDLFVKLQFFGGHLLTFILGYFLASYKRKIPNWLLITIATVDLLIITYGTYALTIKTGAFDQTFQSQSSGYEVVLASCVFLLFKQNVSGISSFMKKIIKPLVALSMPIYFMHLILLSMFGTVGIQANSFLGTISVTLLNLLICYIVMKTVATIKPLCYIATGMSFKQACSSCNWMYTYCDIKNYFDKSRKNKTFGG